jgi:hypothetical protein
MLVSFGLLGSLAWGTAVYRDAFSRAEIEEVVLHEWDYQWFKILEQPLLQRHHHLNIKAPKGRSWRWRILPIDPDQFCEHVIIRLKEDMQIVPQTTNKLAPKASFHCCSWMAYIPCCRWFERQIWQCLNNVECFHMHHQCSVVTKRRATCTARS